MSTVQEIERAIEKLSEQEVAQLREWLWDLNIERDAKAGRFDSMADAALQEREQGKTRRL